ncbi:nebulette isoform X2 [Xenopus laevis]|uniref:Nebulette isoform X2 n=1 Tax=Xenopus laevis TaxID=8355 RepID=A0A8J1KVZ6_XENLA|nr:nebulette isoform X2 [Xenopus laevis]
MNPQCARCGRVVYPTEKVNCLDKFWHKGCFHCEVCKMTLNMNNYKGYDKKPYCNAHYPKQSFTTVTDTPENLRLKQQSEIQSQVKYKKDFEESKGRGFSIVTDALELQRLKKTQEQISNIKYHEDFEKTKGKGFTPVVDDPITDRVRKNTQIVSDAAYKNAHPHVVEMDRRSVMVVERASQYNRHYCHSAGAVGLSQGDDRSEVSEMNPGFSYYSEGTRASDEEVRKGIPFTRHLSISQIYLQAQGCLVHICNITQAMVICTKAVLLQ